MSLTLANTPTGVEATMLTHGERHESHNVVALSWCKASGRMALRHKVLVESKCGEMGVGEQAVAALHA